jgi:hypothetical protein
MTDEDPAHTGDEAERSNGRCRDGSKLLGILKWQGPPLSLEDMQAAIETGAVARYRRATGATPPAEDQP